MADQILSQTDSLIPADFRAHNAALAILYAGVQQALELATQTYRQTEDILSADERANIWYWSRFVMAMMSQDISRKVDAAVKAKVQHVILEAAAEVKEFNADHSYGYLASQAIDRMANRLLAEDLPLQIREAAYDAIGGQK